MGVECSVPHGRRPFFFVKLSCFDVRAVVFARTTVLLDSVVHTSLWEERFVFVWFDCGAPEFAYIYTESPPQRCPRVAVCSLPPVSFFPTTFREYAELPEYTGEQQTPIARPSNKLVHTQRTRDHLDPVFAGYEMLCKRCINADPTRRR